MAESAPDKRRGFFGSFLEFGTTVGFILAAIVCTTLIAVVGDAGMEAGWWRLPFLLTIPLGLTALWIRTRLTEAPGVHGGLRPQGDHQVSAAACAGE
ncbi:MFS transporter [Arthrobacter sp. Z1-15]